MRGLKITKSITHREDESLDKYLSNIGKEKLITTAEEIELAQRIKKGDTEAVKELTRANLRFVVSVAKQYQNQGMSLPDLIQEGNLGLIKGAERFDETRGFKFISYAVWRVRQGILGALAEQGRIVRLPLNKINTLNKIKNAFSLLEQELSRDPTNEELAEKLEMHENQIQEAMEIRGRHVSLDAPLVEDDTESSTMKDLISNNDFETDKGLIDESLKKDISRSLNTLKDREALVIRLFYGLDGNKEHTLEEIGEKIDLTREHVRQIKEKAIKKLNIGNRGQLLKKHLG